MDYMWEPSNTELLSSSDVVIEQVPMRSVKTVSKLTRGRGLSETQAAVMPCRNLLDMQTTRVIALFFS